MTETFRHTDTQRTILFGADALERALEELDEGFTLLSTARAQPLAPALAARAAVVIDVPVGRVEQIAAELRAMVRGERLVALGGGRVIDVAKALAAADPPRTVAAVPTTLSGAEMTGVHRHAHGVSSSAPRVRPDLIVNQPDLSASQPVQELAASSANALGHAVIGLTSDEATPVSAIIAREATRRIVAAWAADDPDRGELALGALLAGWAVDLSGLGLHHVLSQTAVRAASLAHAHANAALLPHTVAALRARRPEALARLDAEVGVELEQFARVLRRRAGVQGVPAFVEDDELLARAVEAAVTRPELERVAPAPDRRELREIYAAAAAPD